MPEILREGIKGGKPQTKSNLNFQFMMLVLILHTVLGDRSKIKQCQDISTDMLTGG